ncbi:MAG: lysine-2,3-aminomutase-like protein [Micavibrio sp.]|nr:lysine-2,3-aminomutase-like protein [Micavibrio sp.]
MNKKNKDYIESLGGSADEALLSRYAYKISSTIENVIETDVQSDPVAAQYIPHDAELNITDDELLDPIGDEAHTPVKGIVHRYPDRVLFKPANVCAVYCRYCFRREMVGPKAGAPADILSDSEIEAALDYIRTTPEIWEVILTGGDPLVLSPRNLGRILDALEAIDHVKVIRIHSRVPIADPSRLSAAMIETLTRDKALYLVVHINHAQEINDDVRNCLRSVKKTGVSLLSQSVLLRGINDKAETLARLFRALVALGVKPYYLHHPDLAPGTSHFRLTIAQGQEIMRALQGRLSGLAIPTYMLDIPGGAGKVPLTPCYIEGDTMIRDYKGNAHHYG